MHKLIGSLVAALVALGSPAFAQTALIPGDGASTRVAVTNSATGTTGATAATLPAVFGKSTYICGFSFFGTNATAANAATSVTVTGVTGGTLTFGYTTLALGAAIPNSPTLTVNFSPCIPATAQNTTIIVNGPALGGGATLATVNAWGYQFSQF